MNRSGGTTNKIATNRHKSQIDANLEHCLFMADLMNRLWWNASPTSAKAEDLKRSAQIAAAISAVESACVLDTHIDPDHNRSVITFVALAGNGRRSRSQRRQARFRTHRHARTSGRASATRRDRRVAVCSRARCDDGRLRADRARSGNDHRSRSLDSGLLLRACRVASRTSKSRRRAPRRLEFCASNRRRSARLTRPPRYTNPPARSRSARGHS